MENFYKELFLKLQKRLSEQVPEILFIDQNIGQYGFDEFRTRVMFPAVLVDFPSATYSALGGNIQLGQVIIELALFFDSYSQTYQMAPEEVKNLGLLYYEIEQKIFNALHGWDADGLCTPLTRTDIKSQNNNDIGMRIRVLNFSTSYEDYSLDNDVYKDVEFSFSGSIKN